MSTHSSRAPARANNAPADANTRPAAEHSVQQAIQIQNLNYAYADREVLRNITTEFNFGAVTGVFGENGAGKTTLLKILAGILPFQQSSKPNVKREAQQYNKQNSALFAAESFPTGSPTAQSKPKLNFGELTRADIGYLGQQVQPAWALKVRSLVELGTLSRPAWSKSEKHHAIENAMQQTDCAHLAERKVSEISTGELQRALLARVLAGQPKVILADEPTAGLDPRHQRAVMQLLQAHARAGGMVIVVMHDLRAGQEYCDNALLLANNVVYAQGASAEVLTPANIFAVFGV